MTTQATNSLFILANRSFSWSPSTPTPSGAREIVMLDASVAGDVIPDQAYSGKVCF